MLAGLPSDEKGKAGLALSIPVAANIGGIGTPIGTPPNATAVGILANNGLAISFSQWAFRMIPYDNYRVGCAAAFLPIQH